MKRLLLGAAVAAIAAFGCSGAFAEDGAAYLKQCKADVANAPKPQNGMPDMSANVLKFCQCIVDTKDQSVIDEAAAIDKLPMNERMQKWQSASPKYKECMQKSFPPPPAGAGGGAP